MIRMRVSGVSGSPRSRSYNAGLLEEAKKMLPREVTMAIADIENLPLFSADRELDPPESVRLFKAKVRQADAILFARFADDER